MRIGFLAPGNPKDVRSYSGVPFFALGALERQDCDAVVIDAGDQSWSSLTQKINNVSYRLSGRRVLAAELHFRRKASARRAQQQIGAANLDALVCLNVDFLIPLLRPGVPIIHNSDATFEAIVNYYPSYANFWKPARARANALSQAALDLAARCSFPSDWAARSARDDYGIASDKVSVIPYGANLTEAPGPDAAAKRRVGSACKLLFIGGAWERKGGPVAFDIMKGLRAQGVDASLTVVGADPGVTHPHLHRHGFLNKQNPDELAIYQALWREASFLCMPSEAETFGAIYSEAAAHGLPVIARDTGGVSGCVKHETSGLLFAPDVSSSEIVDKILQTWRDDATYRGLVTGARARFESRLNWDAWARDILDLALSAVADTRSH